MCACCPRATILLWGVWHNKHGCSETGYGCLGLCYEIICYFGPVFFPPWARKQCSPPCRGFRRRLVEHLPSLHILDNNPSKDNQSCHPAAVQGKKERQLFFHFSVTTGFSPSSGIPNITQVILEMNLSEREHVGYPTPQAGQERGVHRSPGQCRFIHLPTL